MGQRFATLEEAQAALEATRDITTTTAAPTPVQSNRFATLEEAQAALASMSTTPAPTTDATEQRQSSFGERFSENLNRRRGEVSEAIEAFATREPRYLDVFGNPQGQVGLSEFVIQLAGKGIAAPVLDTVSDVVITAGKNVYGLLPGGVREDVAEYAQSALDWVTNSPLAEEAWHYVQQGADAYAGWKERNPSSARTLESIVNISSVLPTTRASTELLRRAPDAEATPLLLRGSHVFDNSARESNRKYATELMRPAKTDVSPANVTQSRLGTQRANLSEWQQQTVQELLKIPLKPKATALTNWKIVGERVSSLDADLIKALDGVVVNPQTTRSFISNNIDDVVNNNLFIRRNAEFKGIIQDVAAEADRLILASDGTAAGLLNARRELDAWVKKQKAGFKFDDPNFTPLNEAVRAIRNGMNEALEASAPGANVGARLTQQSHLLGAMDNLNDLFASEAATALGRIAQSLKRGTGLHISSTPVGVAATAGIGASLLGSSWIPYIGIPVAVLGGATLAYRGIMSPSTSRVLAGTLREMNRLVETTRDPILNAMYVADRAVLIDLLSNTQVDKTEETNEPQ